MNKVKPSVLLKGKKAKRILEKATVLPSNSKELYIAIKKAGLK